MVMPCSRSARRPSVSRARSAASRPRSRLTRSTASSWSARTDLVSWSRRPTRVDLPSSTEPAVASRSRSCRTVCGMPRGWLRRAGAASYVVVISEVPLLLAVLHGGLRQAVVGAGRAPLGDPGGRDLADHLGHVNGIRLDRAGAAHVTHRPVAHSAPLDALALARAAPPAGGEPHPVAGEHLPLVGVVERRQL